MDLFDIIRRKFSGAGTAISAWRAGSPIFTPRDYRNLTKEAYLTNVIAYKCINMIARNLSGVPWIVYKNEKEVEKHPLIDLLKRPNPLQTGSEFFHTAAAFYLCSGNSYLEAVKTGRGRPGELYSHRPDRIKIIASRFGVPAAYRYENDGEVKEWEVDIVKGTSEIKHIKTFHPLDDWYGMSPIEAAAYAIDQHNEASKFNTSMLQNGMFASGLFSWKTNPHETERKRFEEMLVKRFVGARNGGKPIVVSGDMTYIDTNIRPKDAQFLDGKKLTAQEICLAFGVNPILIFNESVSYNNIDNARLELWEDTVIPLLETFEDAINGWLIPMFGEQGLEVRFDISETPVMQKRQEKIDEQARGAYRDGLIKKNEARVAMGWDEVTPAEGGEEFYSGGFGSFSFDSGGKKPDPNQADPNKMFVPENIKALDGQSSLLLVNELDRREVISETGSIIKNMLDALVVRFGASMVEEIGNIAAFESTIRVQDFVIKHSAELVTQINDTTKNQLRNEILEWFGKSEKVSELANRINAVFNNAEEVRSKIIAQTEATGAAGFGALEAMVQSGVEKMEWFTSFQNSRDAHIAMNGQQVPVLDGYFHAPSGSKTRRPGGFGIASLDINCNCAIGLAITEKSAHMTHEQKASFWQKREAIRVSELPGIEKILKQVFNIQRRAILKRLDKIGG